MKRLQEFLGIEDHYVPEHVPFGHRDNRKGFRVTILRAFRSSTLDVEERLLLVHSREISQDD